MDYSDSGNAGWNNEDTDLPEGFYEALPKPTFWRVLVAPTRPKVVSKGGIVLAIANQEAQEILNFIGKVVALGPMAGVHERLGGNGVAPAPGFPKIGDYVAFGRYSGQKVSCMGVKVLLLNDDEILAVVPNPDALQTSR